MTITNTVENVFQQHGFVTLSTGLDGVWLAVLNHDSNATACCDVLAYRQINGEGMTLEDEVTLISQALPQIRQQLHHNPHLLSPAFYFKPITLLGKKVQILYDGSGRPLHCRLQPLILLPEQNNLHSTNNNSNHHSIPTVPLNHLNQYLEKHFTESTIRLPPLRTWLNPLRRSYKLLGSIPLILFPLMGLAGLLLSFGWAALGTIATIFAGLIPIMLILTAIGSFRDFQQKNAYTIRIASQDNSESTVEVASRAQISDAEPQPPKEPLSTYQGEPSKTWTTATIAAFLQDSIESALIGALNSYKTENWNSYTLHLRTFMVNGVRLSILKKSSQEPPEQIEQILDQIPHPDIRQDLEAWLQRLVSAHRSTPLALMEAEFAANFAILLLKKLQVLQPDWEARIYSIIPKRTPLRPQKSDVSKSPISHLKPTTPPALPLVSTASSETEATLASIQPVSTSDKSEEPGQRTSDVSSSAVTGVPLRIVSKGGMDELIRLIQAGASPYLFVFANRYLASWTKLGKLVDQVAETMGSQVNVVVFPVLGDSKINEDVQEFISRFRTEDNSSLSPLPFIIAVSRTVLIHIIESEIPVPSELIITPHPEDFLVRVQEAITIAQSYQVNLEDPSNSEKEISTSASPITPSKEEAKPAVLSTSELLADTDDVVEEVTSASSSSTKRRVMEVDTVAAKQRRELATMVPVALAVVHLPEDQPLLDALEAAAQKDPHLVAQFVDLACSPEASKILKIPRGSVRLRFDGTEQTLENPETEHLLASLHKLRKEKSEPSQDGVASNGDTRSVQTGQMELPVTPQRSSSKRGRKRRTSRKIKQKV